MRVALLMPPPGGPSRIDYSFWRDSITSLGKALSGKGCDVALFGGNDALPYLSTTEYCLKISEFLEKAGEFDLIHGHFDPLLASFAQMTATPIVVTLDGPMADRTVSLFARQNGSVSYVSLSDGARSPSLDYIATIYPAVDVRRFPFQNEGNHYLLCFARLLGKRELRTAEHIAAEAGRTLVVAGGLKDRRRIDAALSAAGQGVEYKEVSSSEEYAGLLSGAYAFLLLKSRGSFIPALLQSMACGTPVLALRAPIVSEFVAHGVTGFTAAQPAHAVGLLDRLSGVDRGLCRASAARRFDVDHVAEEWLSIYATILAKKAREDHRPWGFYEVLSDARQYKVKRIVVFPGKRLSLQRHLHRAEHWHILSGRAQVRCGDEETCLERGQSIDIPEEALHRIQNPGPDDVMFIEVQRGDYCGEDDIERFEDDYGRV